MEPAEPGPAPTPDPEPAEPVQPAEPVEPGQPEEPPAEPVPSAQPAEPAQAAQPTEPAESSAEAAEPVELVELALASVELSAEGVQPATGTVSLVEMEGGGRLDIVMARADAVLVQEAIADIAPPRPRTHDLLLATIDALAGAVLGVTLVERRAGWVYVANLRVRRPDGSTVELDARPSDALNVALRSRGAALRAARSLLVVPAN